MSEQAGSRLQDLLLRAREGLAPWEPLPPEALRAVAARCGPAERAEMRERIAALRRERDEVPAWDGDTQDDVWRAIETFESLLALSDANAGEEARGTFAPPPGAEHIGRMRDDGNLSRWVRAGLLTGITDGLFSTILAGAVYQSGVGRLWRGVAAALLGPGALEGGTGTALVGVAMHFGVAFAWSAVFVFGVMRSAAVRRALASRGGAVRVAAVYGPCIWLVMSLVVIPLLLHRPPTINLRWWVQLAGHFPFVGLSIALAARRGLPRPA